MMIPERLCPTNTTGSEAVSTKWQI